MILSRFLLIGIMCRYQDVLEREATVARAMHRRLSRCRAARVQQPDRIGRLKLGTPDGNN